MNIEIPPKLARFVEEQVSAGRFLSAEEVVHAGLARLMLDPLPANYELDEETRAAIAEADAQSDRGEGMDLDEAFALLRVKHNFPDPR